MAEVAKTEPEDATKKRKQLRQRVLCRYGPVLPEQSFRGKQAPMVPGEPIPMTEYNLATVPKSFGNPWYGAYSKHGFWYKFHIGNENDFDRTVAWSIDTDQWTMVYDDYRRWKEAFGDDLTLVAVKNQRDDYIATIAFAKHGADMGFIGVYWVMEDWRNSGIGTELFAYAMKKLAGRNVGVYGVNYLWEKIRDRQDFRKFPEWKLQHIIVDKPQALKNLEGVEGIKMSKLEDVDMSKVVQYDKGVVHHDRGNWLRSWLTHPDGHTRIALSTTNEVVGYGMVREAAGGGDTKWLTVGPIYANDERVGQALLYQLLYCYADETEHPDYDPNLQAIEHRTVHLFVPSCNRFMADFCTKIKGDGENVLTQAPFHYRLLFNKELPQIDMSKVFCAADWQMAVI